MSSTCDSAPRKKRSRLAADQLTMADSWAELAYSRGFNNHHVQCSSDGTLMDVGRQLLHNGVGDSLWTGMDWQQRQQGPVHNNRQQQQRSPLHGNRQQQESPIHGNRQQQLRNHISGMSATATNFFAEHPPSVLDLKQQQQMREFHPYPHQNVDPNVAKRGPMVNVAERVRESSADSFGTTVNFEWELDQQRRIEPGGSMWRNSKPHVVECAPMRESEPQLSRRSGGFGGRVLEEVSDLPHLPALDFHQLQEFQQHPALCFDAPSSQEKVASNDGSENMDCLIGAGDLQVTTPDAVSPPSPCFKSHTHSSPNNDGFDLLAGVSPPQSENNNNASSFPWPSEFAMCDSFSDDLGHNVSTSLSSAASFLLPETISISEPLLVPQHHHPLALDLTREAMLEYSAPMKMEAVPMPKTPRSLSSSRESSQRRDSPPSNREGVRDIRDVKQEMRCERTPAADTTSSMQNWENGNLSLQLRNCIMKCAEAIEGRNDSSARTELAKLEELSSPNGNFTQRVASCFFAALSQRLGEREGVPIRPPAPQYDLLEDCALTEACPYSKFVHLTANQAMLESVKGEQVLHIIDFGVMQGVQWSALLQALATEHGRKPPRIRVTGIASAKLGPNPSASLLATGRRLSEFAKLLGLQLEFNPLMKDLQSLEPAMFRVAEGECVAINLTLQLHRHVGDTNEKLLKLVRSLKPKVVVLVEYEAAVGKMDFRTRLLDGLEHFCAIFESLEATMPRESTQRAKIEKQILAEDIKALFGSQSTDATVRHETFQEWSSLMDISGFKAIPPSHYSTSQARLLLWLYNDKFKLMPSSNKLSLGWKDRRLIIVSTWKSC